MIRSVNEGVPLVVAARPAAAALRRVAQAVIGIPEATATVAKQDKRRMFGRR